MNRKRQSGEGRLGLLIAVIVVGIAIFLGIKIIPVRIAAYQFKDTLREQARMGAVHDENSTIKHRILREALDLEIPLDKKNLKVTRTPSKIIISAQYEVPIDLKFTTYTYRFDHTEKAPLF